MSNTFLSSIDGLSSENLVSETLRYILSETSFTPFQRLFFGYLLGQNVSTFEGNFEIETRPRFDSYGSPDILIAGSDLIALIENKFYAPYSGSDQLSRYYKLLLEHSDFKRMNTKILVLLTTSSREKHYIDQILTDFKSIYSTVSNIQNLIAQMKATGIEFKILYWQEIIRLFESDDLLVSSLRNYIRINYIGEVQFMSDEIKALKSKEYASAMEKLLECVNILRERIHSDTSDTKKSKMSQSINFYGFSIKLKNLSAWFGYFRPLWNSYEPYTPLYLQVRTDWITNDKIDFNAFVKRLEGVYFYNDEHGYVKPYSIDKLNDLDFFAEELRKDLEYLDQSN